MATLDDRILGEKLQYYCSSSEDEDDKKEKSKSDQENTEWVWYGFSMISFQVSQQFSVHQQWDLTITLVCY